MENMHPQPGHAAVARTSRMGAYSCVVTRRMGCRLYGVRLCSRSRQGSFKVKLL